MHEFLEKHLFFRSFRSLAPCAIVASLSVADASLAQPAKIAPRHAPVTLVCEGEGVPAGGEVAIGLLFDVEPGWHIYWNGTNDTGIAPDVEWTAPKGFKVGGLQWPTPVAHVAPGDLLDHIYEGKTLLIARLKAPDDARPGTRISIKGDVSLLVCKDACIPEKAEVSIEIPVLAKGSKASDKGVGQPIRAAFESTRSRLPRPLEDADTGSVKWSGATATVKFDHATSVCFFPSTDCSAYANPIGSRCGKDFIALKFADGDGSVLSGVVEVKRASETSFIAINARPGDAAPAGPGDNGVHK